MAEQHREDAWLARVADAERAPSLGALGRYELLEIVGRGGQGVVLRARDRETGDEVALKRLAHGVWSDDEERGRLERELTAARAVDHPGIVKVRACESIDGQPALVMDWIDGVSITEWAEGAPSDAADVKRRVTMLAALCDAVHHAHQRGVIHRDLKPSNVLVCEGRPFLLDLGLAKLEGVDDDLSCSDRFLGTVAYAAPERFDGRDRADVRADVWSLGVILHQLLSGARPWTGSTPAALVAEIRSGPPAPPSRSCPVVDSELDAVVACALSLSPDDRYASVEALGADLRRALDGAPLAAMAPRRGYLLRKALRRHARAVAAVLVVMTALAGSAVWSAVAALELAEARDDAVASEERRLRAWVNAWRTIRFLQSAMLTRAADGGATLNAQLAEAMERLDAGELADNPEARGEVQLVIARVLRELGRAEEAVHLFGAGCASLESAPERSDQHLVHGRIDHGRALHGLARPEAVSVLRRALSEARRLSAPEPRIRARLALADVLESKHPDEARRLRELALEVARRELPAEHRLLGSSRRALGL